NEVFAILPNATIGQLRSSGAVLNEWLPSFLPNELELSDSESVVRLVCSFQTTDAEVEQFISHL
ncbi:MAG: threonine aldolase, partial [Reinekea sp.]